MIVMVKKSYISPFLLAVFDFILLNLSFFGMNYWKRGTFELSPVYVKLLVAFYFIWLVVSLFTKKFRIDFNKSYQASMLLLTRSTIYIVYCVALMVVIMGLHGFSRLQVFGTCGLFFIGEVIIFSFCYVMINRTENAYADTDYVKPKPKPKPKPLLILSVSDFLLVTFIFFIVNYLKRGTFDLPHEYEKLLLIIYGLWFFTALITRKFDSGYRNYYYAMAQWIKAVMFMAATMAVLIFAFRLFYYSMFQIFVFFIFLILTESVLYFIYYFKNGNGQAEGDIESIEEIKGLIKQEDLSLDIDMEELRSRLTRPIRDKLQKAYLGYFPKVFNFIDETLDLSRIIKAETTIINSSEMFHLTTVDEHPIRLFINIDRVNNVRWVNRYFLEVHKLLLPGGYFVGRTGTIALHRKKFFEKYPKYFSQVFYFINFIFRRLFPKLPVTNKVYFAITKGKNRVLSRAEVLGRLIFCGFKIVAEREIGDDLYFIAQKVKMPSIEENPSYGPFIQLKRVGYHGTMISVYKIRTMHPYAEYLQQYVYEKYGTQKDGDKFENDFRITSWGNLLRKLWIDEIPMIYNFINGEIKLVGVRPLSFQKFNIYNKDLKQKRLQHKPGLIPPFYADLPETFENFMESEKKYLELYEKQPIITDIKYFFKACRNIIFKNARSK